MTAPSPPRSRDRRAEGDEGLTVVLVALLATVMLLFAALAIDGGMGYKARRESQNASDAAAMAGVRALEHLKFYGPCTAVPTPVPCTTFTSTAAVRTEILEHAHRSGADTDAGGVRCWFLDVTRARVGNEFCEADLTPGSLAAYSGVEVRTRQTNDTYFGQMADIDEISAGTSAKAYTGNFAGGTGSPFVLCGVQDPTVAGGTTLAWAYDLLRPVAGGGFAVQGTALGRYYQIQGSQNPTCGADSGSFKGLTSGETIPTTPFDVGITTGNAFVNNVQLAVAGIAPCPPGASQFSGCGMLLPIADVAQGSGGATTMHVIGWLAFQVWGSGSSYSFAGSPSDPTGTSCRSPISPGGGPGSVKYCGRLLGSATVTGGASSGPATAGQSHVLKLVE